MKKLILITFLILINFTFSFADSTITDHTSAGIEFTITVDDGDIGRYQIGEITALAPAGISGSFNLQYVDFDVDSITDNITETITFENINATDYFLFKDSDNNYIDITDNVTVNGNNATFTVVDNGIYDLDNTTGKITTNLYKTDETTLTSPDTSSSSGGCSTGDTNSFCYLLLIILFYMVFKINKYKVNKK
jgi:hypothetical protein